MEYENSTNDYFVNPDGIKLFRLIHKPKECNTKALVFICHGLFEHCQAGYYKTIITPLNDIGCLVVSHDHRGHGLSEGKRGMIYNFHSLVRDVLLDIDEVIEHQQVAKNIPIFIYGHSMGGLISVYATLERKSFFTGMCLEAPALSIPKIVGKFAIFIGKMMDRVFPTFPIGKGNLNDICRNPEVRKQIENDKLCINKGVPARTGMQIANGIKQLESLMKDVETPFIIGHGDADKICELEGSEYFMEHCSTTDKTLLKYPNAKHQLRNEIENVDFEFCEQIVKWIDEKIQHSN